MAFKINHAAIFPKNKAHCYGDSIAGSEVKAWSSLITLIDRPCSPVKVQNLSSSFSPSALLFPFSALRRSRRWICCQPTVSLHIMGLRPLTPPPHTHTHTHTHTSLPPPSGREISPTPKTHWRSSHSPQAPQRHYPLWQNHSPQRGLWRFPMPWTRCVFVVLLVRRCEDSASGKRAMSDAHPKATGFEFLMSTCPTCILKLKMLADPSCSFVHDPYLVAVTE